MAKSPLSLFFIGDDLVAGAGDPTHQGFVYALTRQAKNTHPDLNLYQLGVYGETSLKLAERIEAELNARLTSDEDNRIVLATGLQDCAATPKISINESVEALKTILKVIKPRAKILVIGPPCAYDPPINMKTKKFSAMMQELCQKSHTPFVSLYESTERDPQYKRDLTYKERVYPGRLGYEKIFNIVSNDRQWWFS